MGHIFNGASREFLTLDLQNYPAVFFWGPFRKEAHPRVKLNLNYITEIRASNKGGIENATSCSTSSGPRFFLLSPWKSPLCLHSLSVNLPLYVPPSCNY